MKLRDLFARKAKKETSVIGAIGGLPEGGRSSQEKDSGLFPMQFGQVAKPDFSLGWLPAIDLLLMTNPDYSMTLQNLITTANTGHEILIEEGVDAAVDAAFAILDPLSRSIWPNGGIDGLINHHLRQVMATGALSAEAWLKDDFSGLRRAVSVPVETIRFKRLEDGEQYPHQKVVGGIVEAPDGLIRLHPLTYRYMALETRENSPYGIPPLLAALEWTQVQRDIMTNIKFIVKKLGLMGLLDVAAKKLERRAGEDDETYRRRNEKYLTDLSKKLGEDYYNGIFAHLDELIITIHQLAGASGQGLNGAIDMIKHVEQMVITGSGDDPAMLGRSYSTTETYAGVVYSKMVRRSALFRLPVAEFIEHCYRLELLLKGTDDLKITVRFNENEPFDAKKTADAEKVKLETAILRARTGLVDPDVVAQELGYASWYDVERLGGGQEAPAAAAAVAEEKKTQEKNRLKFRFDAGSRRYRFERPQIVVRNAPPEDLFEKWVKIYLARLQPLNAEWLAGADEVAEEFLASHSWGDFTSGEDFADRLIEKLRERFNVVYESGRLKSEIRQTLREMYTVFRLTDSALWGEVIPPELYLLPSDSIVMQFLNEADSFYFSKFIDNSDMFEPLRGFMIEKYVQGDARMFGRTGPEQIAAFRAQFGDKLAHLTDWEVRRIIDTGVQRSRSWANIKAMRQVGVTLCEVHEIIDLRTCPICERLHGKVVKVEKAAEVVDRFAAMAPETYQLFLENNRLTVERIDRVLKEHGDEAGMDLLTEQGVGFPPYHPHCRGQVLRRRTTVTVPSRAPHGGGCVCHAA